MATTHEQGIDGTDLMQYQEIYITDQIYSGRQW